ncbi:hypothetical protein LP7551_02606 [Roseibium album]|nr:hypothetical protein LP7551_02606 [Roseibium album]
MDSITQFVLGAAVSTAFLGKTLGPRKAALIGGALGTLPDLDVFLPFDDPIDSFVYHRGWTHSVFVHALAAPFIGEGLRWLFKGLKDHRWLVWVTVFLCLSTHAMIDAMTVYGTRIFWPFYPDPVGVGSVFIIDPLYSLPLLGVVIWALCKKTWTTRLRNGVIGVLAITTAYMGLSVVIQHRVEAQARTIFEENGGVPDKIYAIASPFNVLVWKVIGLSEDRYENLYISLLDTDGPAEIYSHPRNPELVACLEDTDAFQKLNWFSRGFYKSDLIDNRVVMSDLRMGLTPGYVFSFAIGELTGQNIEPATPKREPGFVSVDEDDWQWLAARLQGIPRTRNAEAKANGTVQSAALQQCVEPVSASG